MQRLGLVGSAFSLAAGALVFVALWLAPIQHLAGTSHGGFLIAWCGLGLVLAWSMRRQYDPISLLATFSFVAAAIEGYVGFSTLATTGARATAEQFALLRNLFGGSAGLAIVALVRIYAAGRRSRGSVLGWVVLIQGLWWAWLLEAWFHLPHSRFLPYVGRRRVVLGFILVGSVVLLFLLVGWLRRQSRPRVAAAAGAIGGMAILWLVLDLGSDLTPDDEILDWWVPVSTTPDEIQPDMWRPKITVAWGGEIVISRQLYSPDELPEWLSLCERKMGPGERLHVEGYTTTKFGSCGPVLRACLDHGAPFTEIGLIVRDPHPERDWREVVADAYPWRAGEGTIPLVLEEAPPEGSPLLILSEGAGDVDLAVLEPGQKSATLRIADSLSMTSVVEQLDRLRARGCRRLHVLVDAR